MCQVYYVRGFIELIYFVAVAFNQGQFMHTGWADLGGTTHLYWNGSGSSAAVSLRYSERNGADDAR